MKERPSNPIKFKLSSELSLKSTVENQTRSLILLGSCATGARILAAQCALWASQKAACYSAWPGHHQLCPGSCISRLTRSISASRSVQGAVGRKGWGVQENQGRKKSGLRLGRGQYEQQWLRQYLTPPSIHLPGSIDLDLQNSWCRFK